MNPEGTFDMPSQPRSLRQVLLSLTVKQKLVLSLLFAVLSGIPLWLSVERVQSAPAKVGSPVLALAAPAAGPTPSVTLDVPDEVLIGEQFKFKVTFNPGTAVGYGPFIDLVLPAGGIDYNDVDPTTSSAGPCDGVTYVPGSAQMTGVNGGPTPVTTDVVSAPCTHTTAGACATLTHPYHANGVSSVASPNILVPEGAQLVTIKLPFGSFQPNQPPIVIQVTAHVSDHADVNALLHIYARAGFQFGLDANNNPTTDPPAPLLSTGGVSNCTIWDASAAIRPVVFTFKVEDRLSANPGPCFDGVDNGNDGLTDAEDPDCKHGKAYEDPEDETATGPNLPHKYKIILNIANGQTVTNLNVQDCLPNNMVLSSVVSTSPPASPAPLPPLGPANSPNNCVSFNYASIVGGPSATDVVIEVEFYIPEKDANGALILNPNCVPVQSINRVKAEGDWTPVDPRDWQGSLTPVPQHVVSNASLLGHVLADKCIAIQKKVSLIVDLGATGPTPGDTLKYELNFQISDFKTVSNIEIKDFLSDGQQLLGTPTFKIADKFFPPGYTGSFVPGSSALSVQTGAIPPCGGVNKGTAMIFRVSTRMGMLPSTSYPRHLLGILTGGHAGLPSSSTPATGQIVFFARIKDQFFFPHPPGDINVDKDDPLNNCVQISANVRQNTNHPVIPPVTSVIARDDSRTAIAIVSDTIKKTVFAVKRTTTLGGTTIICGPGGPGPCSNSLTAPQEVRPGDQVTFEIQKKIPSSDAEKLTIQDFQPLPVLNVTDPNAGGVLGPAWVFSSAPCTIPSPGFACFGPSNNLTSSPTNLTVSPTVTQNGPTNSVIFDYHSFNQVANQSGTIDLLYTNTVTNQPFADGLYLTNQAQECEYNSFGVRFCQSAIAMIKVREPNLQIRKGVIATDNPHGVFTQPAIPQTLPNHTATPPAGATLSLGGISGIVNSTDLAAGRLNSDISHLDANDIVTFAITIENLGGHPAYDSKLEEIIPLDSIGNPTFAIVSPITVNRGTGAAVLPALYTLSTSATGFTITAASNVFSYIPQFHPTNGSNIIVITFQAKLSANIIPVSQSNPPGCWNNEIKLEQYASKPGGPDFVGAGFTGPFKEVAEFCVNPTLTKSVVATSEAHTIPQTAPPGTPQVAIGEIVRYHLDVAVPEGGNLTNVQIKDVLPAGMQYLNDNTARIGFVSNQIAFGHPSFPATFNVTPPGNAPASGAALTALPQLPAGVGPPVLICGAPATFNLGDIKNNDSDDDLEYVSIEFNALVCNVPGNQSGNPPLPNTFSVSVNNIQIATSNSIDVKVVEPHLDIQKAFAPLTPTSDASFTVTLKNTGTADAFDVHLTDALPSGVTLVSVPPPNVSVFPSGCAVPQLTVSGSTLTVDVPKLGLSPCIVTLKFWVKGVCAMNTAQVSYSSLPGGINSNPALPVGTQPNSTGTVTPCQLANHEDCERLYSGMAQAMLDFHCP
jgi:large repetitive protein